MCQEGVNLVAKAALGGVFANTIAAQPKTEDHPTRGKHQNDEATIFQGAILTIVDDQFSPVDAISIKGDIITSVGTLADVQRVAGIHAPVRSLDEEQAIVPGFIDPREHSQLLAVGGQDNS
jgi:hypothetical protein